MYNNIVCRLKEEAFQSFFSFFLSGERCVPSWRKERYFFLALEYYFKAISFDVSDWI